VATVRHDQVLVIYLSPHRVAPSGEIGTAVFVYGTAGNILTLPPPFRRTKIGYPGSHHRKQDVNPFSRFCTANPRDSDTQRLTYNTTESSVAINQ